MTDTDLSPKRSRLRRLTSFSLRTALIATTVLAVWLGLHMNSARKQRAAIEAVHRHGGTVQYDYESPENFHSESAVPAWLLDAVGRDHFYDVVWVGGFRPRSSAENDERIVEKLVHGLPSLEQLSIHHVRLDDEDLRQVSQFAKLRDLFIADTSNVTDQGMAHLANLNQLERLNLHHVPVSNDSLRVLSQLPKLEYLGCQGMGITDDGLEHLRNLKGLRHLKFYRNCNQITDDGLAHLKELPRLETLRLNGSQITDDGLRHLNQMTQLKTLDLSDSQVTDDGLVHLRRLTQLEYLGLQGSQVTGRGVSHLVGLNQLGILWRLEDSEANEATWLQERRPRYELDF